MKTIQERMRLFHDGGGELHRKVDKGIAKINKRSVRRTAVALTMAAAVLVGSLFTGPEEIAKGSGRDIVNPTPIVLDIDSIDADPGEAPAPQVTKKQSLKERLRAALLAMPLWARIIVLVPLWALGYALLLLGGLVKTLILAPLAGVLASALIGIAAMIGLFAITAKLLFPDLPWRKILSKGNLIILIVLGAALAAADVIVPHYYSAYPYVAAAVKLTATLVVINVLLLRLKSVAAKWRQAF